MQCTTFIPTTVVGSYPQPHWLIDRAKLGAKVPRVRAPDIWRIAPPYLEAAQNDATLLAIGDMERAGIDIISDGEMRRESYSNRFATALDGIDIDNPGTTINRSGLPIPGATCRRTHTPARAGRGHGCGVPAQEHLPPHQDHPARPVHHGAAGAGRLLQGRGSARDGARRGGERRDSRPQGRGRRRGADRRALAAGAAGPRASATA